MAPAGEAGGSGSGLSCFLPSSVHAGGSPASSGSAVARHHGRPPGVTDLRVFLLLLPTVCRGDPRLPEILFQSRTDDGNCLCSAGKNVISWAHLLSPTPWARGQDAARPLEGGAGGTAGSPTGHVLARPDIGHRAPRPAPLGLAPAAGLWLHAAIVASVQAFAWNAGSNRIAEGGEAPGVLTYRLTSPFATAVSRGADGDRPPGCQSGALLTQPVAFSWVWHGPLGDSRVFAPR